MHPFKKMIYMLRTGGAPTSPPSTSYLWRFSSPGRSSSGLACAQIDFPLSLYTVVNVLEYGVQMYINPDLTTEVGSGNLWYQEGIDGVSYRIDDLGQIAEITVCGI